MGLPPPEQDPQAVRDLADRILGDARYDRPPRPLAERVLDWIGERLGDLFGTLVGGGGGTVIAWLVLLGAIGGVVYLLVRYGRVSLPSVVRDDASRVMVELTRSPDEWRAAAADHEAAGRWAEGLRCRHRALVAALVRQGVVADQAGRTAREHGRDVATHLPAAAPAMGEATDLFEAAWYGGRPTGPDEARRFEALEATVLGVPAR